jgi:hypothetical protein
MTCGSFGDRPGTPQAWVEPLATPFAPASASGDLWKTCLSAGFPSLSSATRGLSTLSQQPDTPCFWELAKP